MTYSPSEPTLKRVQEMLNDLLDDPTARRLSQSGFDIDMGDVEQANALATHVLRQLQILDATTRMLAATIQSLQSRIEGTEQLFL